MGAFVFHLNRIEWAGMEESISILNPTPNLCFSNHHDLQEGGDREKNAK